MSAYEDVQELVEAFRKQATQDYVGSLLIIYAKNKKGKTVRHKRVGRLDSQTRNTAAKS